MASADRLWETTWSVSKPWADGYDREPWCAGLMDCGVLVRASPDAASPPEPLLPVALVPCSLLSEASISEPRGCVRTGIGEGLPRVEEIEGVRRPVFGERFQDAHGIKKN